jgi:hypothetical protein
MQCSQPVRFLWRATTAARAGDHVAVLMPTAYVHECGRRQTEANFGAVSVTGRRRAAGLAQIPSIQGASCRAPETVAATRRESAVRLPNVHVLAVEAGQ